VTTGLLELLDEFEAGVAPGGRIAGHEAMQSVGRRGKERPVVPHHFAHEAAGKAVDAIEDRVRRLQFGAGDPVVRSDPDPAFAILGEAMNRLVVEPGRLVERADKTPVRSSTMTPRVVVASASPPSSSRSSSLIRVRASSGSAGTGKRVRRPSRR
jgi:hypothetical protein